MIPAEIDVPCARIVLSNNNGAEPYTVGESWLTVMIKFIQTMCVQHLADKNMRRLFVKHGNIDESFRIAGDYELLLRELKAKDAFFIEGLVVTAMRQGGVSSDPANTLLGLREVRLAQIKNGIKTSGWGWRLALSRTYIRLVLWRLLGDKQARKLLDVGRRCMGLPAYWTKT